MRSFDFYSAMMLVRHLGQMKSNLSLFLSIFSFLFLFSCVNQVSVQPAQSGPKVVSAEAYSVPDDSIMEPVVVPIDKSKLTKKPCHPFKEILGSTNVFPAGEPEVIAAGNPFIYTPGTDTFLLPKEMHVIDSPFVAGAPEIVIAKDAYSKDHNPQNFVAFNKLQGMKSAGILCMLEDQLGNIWFGTSGGATKFDGKNFTHYTKNEGLSDNAIMSMKEDKFGNIWFGTYYGGLTKFDGKHFTHFNEKSGLSNREVYGIAEDKNGNLWFSFWDEGVVKYDGKRYFHYTKEQGMNRAPIYHMIEDKFGNIWFASWGAGITKFNGTSFVHFTTEQGLCNDNVRNLQEDQFGNIWIATFDGLSKFDGHSFTNYSQEDGLIDSSIEFTLEDQNGFLWIATNEKGVLKFDGVNFTIYSENQGLNSNSTGCILEDKNGNLWFGTDGGGVSKFQGNYFTHFTNNEGLSSSEVRSILQDKSGSVWFGTNGGGITKYDGKMFTHITQNDGLSSNVILSLLEDQSGNIWIGTDNGLVKFDGSYFTHYTENDGLGNNVVMTLMEDSLRNIWIGTYGGGVSKYDGNSFTIFKTEQGLSHNIIVSSYKDKHGNLWFGTLGGGVTKYNGKQFIHFTVQSGLSHNSIYSILEDYAGNIWFGTWGSGITKYDGKNFTHFNENQGLINNVVVSSLADQSGNLWFGTRFGLSKINEQSLEKIEEGSILEEDIIFQNYGYEEGFLGIGCWSNAIMEDTSGYIWVGSNDRLTAYHLPIEDIADTSAPNIQLTSIGLFNENIDWVELEKNVDSSIVLGNGVEMANFNFEGLSKWYNIPQNLSLAHDNNYVNFNFIGITLNQPKKVRYKYKLEGYDENWSALTDRTEVLYGNLSHGDYVFKMKARSGEGYWSNEFHYAFSVRPPWWKTVWFRLSYISIILVLIYLFYRWRTGTLIKQKEILEKRVEERTAEVAEQKQLIEEKHKEITDSINYAERIQRSFLATHDLLSQHLKDYFIFFQPKDVVSGDFYWASKLSNGNFVLVTADSTGHGVPGAIMSIANIACLKESVTKGMAKPHEIFNETRRLVIDYLKNDGSFEGGKDGMDASLICFDFDGNKLEYAGANNPIWIVRPSTGSGLGEILEFAPDKMPVGKHDKQHIPFTSNQVELKTGDVVYTFTDGMPDQFGGEKGKKFMYKKLKELLISIANDPMEMQKEKLKKAFFDWKGDLEQVDDVCVIGVRI